MIVNRYPGKCQSCNVKLAQGEGFAYKNGYKWFSVCKSTACHKRLGLKAPTPENQIRKVLDDEGFITMPYDRDAIPLLRSMPGARWNPEKKQWKVSIEPGDLPRVLEVASQLQLDVSEVLQDMCVEGTEESREALERAERKRSDGATLFPYQKKGVEFLALHNRAILADDMGLGKALSNGTPVLTPIGWVPIEELVIGDEVFGCDGKPHKVTGVFPQGVLPIFDVTFSDGRSVQCSEDHLWSVQTPNDRVRNPDKFRTHTLKEIVEVGLEDHNGNRKWFISLPKPIKHCEKDFPVHPYVLGALLANGTLARAITHTGLPEQRARLVECGVEFEHKEYDSKWSFYIKNADNLKAGLKNLNLQYKNCYNKFIPEDYFWGSVEQRLALLQGLVDNDGTVSKDGMVVEYNTSSNQLADDVIRLARSLGGVVKISTRKPKYTYKGDVKVGSTDYRIRIKLPNHLCPVTIPFKKDWFVANSKYPPALSIANVVEAGETECTCISVDAEDKLFVTKDYIVTHNTVQALVALPAKQSVILIAPAAVKYNWESEIKMWRPDYRIHICNGRKSFRMPEHGDIIIVNYEILPDWLKPTKKIGEYRGKAIKGADLTDEQIAQLAEITMIVDEAHKAKNYKAARTQKITELSRNCKRVWFLTGTPLMNRPQDLYGVLQAGDMKVFTWNKFCELFNAHSNGFGIEFGMPSPEVPELMKRVMLRRLKSEVLKDLPPKTYQKVDIPLDKATIKKLNDFLIEAGMDPKKVQELESQLDMAELPGFSSFSKIRELLAESRIPAMLEMVEEYEETDTPLLVFSAHKAPIKALKGRDGWEIIDGDTPAQKRFQIQEDFQAGKLKGVGLTIGAGGVGLNLTYASNALFVDLDWTPAMNIQAEDRIVRIGQTSNSVLIKRMASNHPLDLHIQKLLEWKLEVAYRALEASIKFNPPKPRPLVQDIEVIEETEEELVARINAAEAEANREIALGRLERVLGRESAKVNDVPEPELTPGRKAMLREALEYMVGRCDGAIERDGIGFSKPDAGIGHWIHNTGLREDDELPFRVLERILIRYRRQLKGQFEEIWKPGL